MPNVETTPDDPKLNEAGEPVLTENNLEEEQKRHLENFQKWADILAHLAINGEPFFVDGKFFMQFQTKNEIIRVNITREINNIIPFPVKEKLPQRI